jgi:predicted Zn-dependent protease
MQTPARSSTRGTRRPVALLALLPLLLLLPLLAGCPATMPRLPGLDALTGGSSAPAGSATAPATPGSAPAASTSTTADDGGSRERAELRARSADLNRHRAQGAGLASVPALEQYLNGLMERIRQAGPQPARYARVLVRAEPGLAAYATDAGHVYVSLGWIENADSEAEIVALLAHEYGHIAAGHVSRSWVGSAGYVALVGAAVRAANRNQGVSIQTNLGASAWSDLLSPAWSRTQEGEADAIALDITHKLGYSYARGPKAFLERIAAWEGSAASAPPPAPARPQPAAPAKPTGPISITATGAAGAAVTSATGTTRLSDTHPDPAQRLADLDVRYRALPRGARGIDGAEAWQAARSAPATAAALTTYRRAAQMPLLLGRNDARAAAQLAEELAAGGGNAFALANAGLGFLALRQPQRSAQLLEAAMGQPESGWMPFELASRISFSQRRFADGVAVLERGFERYGRPTSLMPTMIEAYRIAGQAEPQGPNRMIYAFKGNGLMAECVLSPEFGQSCKNAALSDQQRAQQAAEQEKQAKEYADKLNQRIERAIKLR